MIYMNNAATSYPKPPSVAKAVADHINCIPDAAHRAVERLGHEPVSCRRRLADLMDIKDENRIIYAMNATAALNMAILGFPWRQGDLVITTMAEHNSVLRPLFFLKKQGILDYLMLPVNQDGRVNEKAWRQALLTWHPRMAVLMHGSNVTGAVNPAEKLSALAAEAGCTVLLDASQTLGVVPVRPVDWKVDMVAFTGHKYLLGPQGTGGLYVSESMELEPIVTGGTGIHSDEDEMPGEMPLRLEAGTQNGPSFAGLNEALRWQQENPFPLEKLYRFVEEIQEKLMAWGYRTVKVEGERTPVMAFASPVYEPEEMGEILSGSYDIICRVGLHCAPKILEGIGAGEKGTVRISLSRFTTREEVDVLLEALEEIGKDHEAVGM